MATSSGARETGSGFGASPNCMTDTQVAGTLDIARWRAEIPLLQHVIPMNHCSQAPLTSRTRAAALRYLDSWDEAGMDWDAWLNEVEEARRAFADLIGAAPEDVALTTSVSEAVSSLASALDYRGDRNTVLISGAEFPTVRHVWLAQEARGAVVREVPVVEGAIETDAWEGRIDERVLLVSACHAYYQNGFVQDVASIAHQAHAQGALLFVDAYQTLGTRSIDVRNLGVDFLASGCLKFLLGTAGLAFLYVRPELVDSLRPAVTGWFGRAEPFSFDGGPLDWAASARRFETGTPPLMNAYVCRAGMDIIREAGPERVQEAHLQLSSRLLEGGAERGLTLHGIADPHRKTVSTAFTIPPECGIDSEEVGRRLLDKRIIGSPRGPAIRLAPHFYTTADEVDMALDSLADIMA
ncbi:MAG: aminotransferase class V-fold PLP-dependent enzyme [Gemmatimonadota bacterium]